MKTMINYHDVYFKCDIFLLADVFGKIRNSSLKITDYVQVFI